MLCIKYVFRPLKPKEKQHGKFRGIILSWLSTWSVFADTFSGARPKSRTLKLETGNVQRLQDLTATINLTTLCFASISYAYSSISLIPCCEKKHITVKISNSYLQSWNSTDLLQTSPNGNEEVGRLASCGQGLLQFTDLQVVISSSGLGLRYLPGCMLYKCGRAHCFPALHV